MTAHKFTAVDRSELGGLLDLTHNATGGRV